MHYEIGQFFILLLCCVVFSALIILFLTRKLRQNNRKYKALFETYRTAIRGTRDGFYEIRITIGEITYFNLDENCLKILGYKHQKEFQDPDSFTRLTSPEDFETVKKVILEARRGSGFFQIKTRMINSRNQQKWILLRGAVNGKKGSLQVLGTWTDIDNEERMNLQLRKDSETFKMIHKYIPLIRWEYNKEDDRVTLTRDGIEEKSHSLEEIWNILDTPDQKEFKELIQQSIAEKKPFEIVIKTKYTLEEENQQEWLHVRGFPSKENKKVQGIAEGVTRFIKIQEEISLQNEMLRTLIDSIPFGIFLKEQLKGQMIYRLWNKKHKLLTNIYEDRIREGVDDYAIFPREIAEKFIDEDMQVIELKKTVSFGESFALDHNKSLINCYKVPIIDSSGEVRYVFGVTEDITDKKEMEIQLLQAQKLDAIGKLAGGIAHDFNNMLAGIMGFTDLLLALKHSKQETEYLEKIHSITASAGELTDKLLTFSRSQKIQMQKVNIHTPIKESLTILKRTINRNIKIITHLKAENPIIAGDSGMLMNMFLNLGINARDAMPEGGEFIIRTENLPLLPEEIQSLGLEVKQKNWVKIIVRDAGSGIPDQSQSKVFEPFYSTKEVGKGTGLGLSAVYGTVMKHSGAIQLDSHVGMGTEFSLYFPILDQSAD